MKNNNLLKSIAGVLIFFLPVFSNATSYTSVANGNWSSSSTWSPTGIPGSGDNATINTNVTVTAAFTVNNITINSGYTLTNNSSFNYTGTLTNNGSLAGSGNIGPTGNTTIFSGNGRYNSYTGIFYIQATAVSSNATIIDPITIVFDILDVPADMQFTNNGFLTLETNSSFAFTANGSSSYYYTVINASGGTIVAHAPMLQASRDILNCTATNNTVEYGTSNDYVDASVSLEYYNLRFFGSTNITKLANVFTILNNLDIASSSTLNVNTENITIQGSLYDSGSITNNTGTVTFNGSVNQVIGGNTSITFKNLTINCSDTVFTALSEAVSNNLSVTGGVLDCESNQLTGNTSGTLTMSSGTGLVLGLTSSSTAVSFPYKFTSAHITLNAGSTVTYQANANQTISDTATYGNLVLNTGITATSKNLMGATTVDGNLLVNSNVTLNSSTYQLTGSSSKTMTMNSGSTLLLGTTSSGTNVSFPTNYTSSDISLNSSSTVEYLANTASQSISVTPTYGNLLIDAGSSVTKTPSGSTLTISGNLTINSNPTLSETTNTINLTGNAIINGTLSFSSGALNVGGNYTNNGVFTYGTSTVTLNGTAGQTINGSASNNFYKLTCSSSGSETVTLGSNETVLNNMQVSSGTFTWAGSSYTLSLSGNFTNNSSFTATSGTITMNGSGSQTIGGSASATFYNLIASGTTVSLGDNETVSNTLTISGGTLDVTTSNYGLTVGGNFTNNATFTPRNGTVTLNGTSGQTIGGTISTTFYKLTGASSGGETITLGNNESVSNNVLISSGTFTLSPAGYAFNIAGNFTASGGTLTASSGTVTMNGSSQTLGGSSLITLYNLTISSGTTTLGGDVTTTGNVTINSTLNGASYTLKTAGNFIDNGTFTPSSGTVYFSNTGHQCIEGTTSTVTFQNMTISALSILGNSGTANITGIILILPGGKMDCTCP